MQSGAVQVLEQLLNTRKACCSDGNTGAPGPMTTTAGLNSRDTSTTSMSTVGSLWDPTYSNHIRSQNENRHMDSSGKAGQHQFMTPPTTASRTGSVVSTGRGGSLAAPQQQQQNQPHQQQRHRIPSLAPSMVSSTSTATSASQQSQGLYDFDPHSSLMPSFHGHHQQHQQQHLQQQQQQQRHHQPQHHHQNQHQNQRHNNNSNPNSGSTTTPTHLAQAHAHAQSSQYRPPQTPSTSVAGTNSCVYAADMITSMAGGDPNEVRQELGCSMPGMECEVDNQLVFNVLDRYTGQVL
jgi:hypothetical protein